MSKVTDVILITTAFDGIGVNDQPYKESEVMPNVQKINDYLDKNECGRQLYKVDQHNKNGKQMQCDMYIGAFNYLDIDNFILLVNSVNWENPQSVQLLMKKEEEETFSSIEVHQP